MDFRLSKEQIMMRNTIREFAQNEVKPLSRKLDAKLDPKRVFFLGTGRESIKTGFKVIASSS